MFGDHIIKRQEEIKKGISDSYNSFEKGGEGSKGGKVIGHTAQGKPVYENFDHEGHKDFSKDDHKQAGKIHGEYSRKNFNPLTEGRDKKKKEKYNFHQREKNKHLTVAGVYDKKN